jgi:hypothetical protein
MDHEAIDSNRKYFSWGKARLASGNWRLGYQLPAFFACVPLPTPLSWADGIDQDSKVTIDTPSTSKILLRLKFSN